MTPFDVAVRILDNQLRSLSWIDEKVRISNCLQIILWFMSLMFICMTCLNLKNDFPKREMLHSGVKSILSSMLPNESSFSVSIFFF
jgi:hypothetical protein